MGHDHSHGHSHGAGHAHSHGATRAGARHQGRLAAAFAVTLFHTTHAVRAAALRTLGAHVNSGLKRFTV